VSVPAGDVGAREPRDDAPAPRGTDVPPFHAGRIGAQAAALARAGRSVIAMHFGQPTEGAPPAAVEAARAAVERGPMGYWESPDLVRRIARHYDEAYGVEVAPERILLTSGASAGLVAAFTTLFAAGDRVALARPGYPAYRNSLQALGRTPVEIDCGPDVAYRLTPAALARVPGALHGVVAASPANPTGAVLGVDDLAALAAECRRRGAWLISDEIYHGITYGRRAVCALEVEPEAVVVNSFSKLYRMPGWRLGWLVVPERVAARLSAHLINLFLTPPALSQHAALAAFDELPRLRASVDTYARNRTKLLDALPRLGCGRVVAPEGAFYFYVDVGHLTDDSLAFCRDVLEATGVSLAPGIDFDPVGGRRCVRLSFALREAEVDEAIARLAARFRPDRPGC
jgi:aspartate/methionine/tyrosine aminotransferase